MLVCNGFDKASRVRLFHFVSGMGEIPADIELLTPL